MNELKVSIIIPTYKRGLNLVKRAIDSLLNQTYGNIEIVLVDDNAKPEHEEFRRIIQQMVADLASEKITYIQNAQNLGPGLTRNAGIEASKGDYITFLDDDDKYLPEKIENQLNFMLKNDLDMSFTDIGLYNENDKLIDYREYSKFDATDKKSILRFHLTRQITGTPTFMFKREILLRINGFDNYAIAEEFFLMSKTIDCTEKIGYLPVSDIMAYRYSMEGLSSGEHKVSGENFLFEYKKRFFNQLSFRDKRFIIFRHHVVLAVAYKRNRKLLRAIWELLIAFFTSPFDALRETVSQYKKVKNKMH